MSAITRRDMVTANIMEPLIDGGYRPDSVRKYSWRCDGCGLVWPMKHQAESCESRGHVASYSQSYAKGPIINGRPSRVDYYDRSAIRRERVEVAA